MGNGERGMGGEWGKGKRNGIVGTTSIAYTNVPINLHRFCIYQHQTSGKKLASARKRLGVIERCVL